MRDSSWGLWDRIHFVTGFLQLLCGEWSLEGEGQRQRPLRRLLHWPEWAILLPLIFPSIRVFSSSHLVAKVLELHRQQQSFQGVPRVDILEDWLIWSPCFPRDSQVSSPGPQFESINSSVLCLLYCPTLTSTLDYWKDHSFDYTDLYWQSGVFAF